MSKKSPFRLISGGITHVFLCFFVKMNICVISCIFAQNQLFWPYFDVFWPTIGPDCLILVILDPILMYFGSLWLFSGFLVGSSFFSKISLKMKVEFNLQ